MTFEQIKKNFDRKLWNKQMVKMAVRNEITCIVNYVDTIRQALRLNIPYLIRSNTYSTA